MTDTTHDMSTWVLVGFLPPRQRTPYLGITRMPPRPGCDQCSRSSLAIRQPITRVRGDEEASPNAELVA